MELKVKACSQKVNSNGDEMPIQQVCPYCTQNASPEIVDSYPLGDPSAGSTGFLAHITCLGKLKAAGTLPPEISAGLRGPTPADLTNPEALMGQLFQLGQDLQAFGAVAEPLGLNSPLRNWVLKSNIDLLAGNRQVSEELCQLMTQHLERHPRDQPVFQALTERLVFDHMPLDAIIHPPASAEVTCITITPPGTSVEQTAQVHAKAMVSALMRGPTSADR